MKKIEKRLKQMKLKPEQINRLGRLINEFIIDNESEKTMKQIKDGKK